MPDPSKPKASDKPTHYPVRNGAYCGVYPVPAHASEYDADEPSCPNCQRLLESVERASRRRWPHLYATPVPGPNKP